MPSWRPAGASDPDDENEALFSPLENRDPSLATALLERYGRRWLSLAGLPESRLPEVPDTVELVVAPDWTEPAESGLLTLRLRSWYTGSTYWMPGWDGSVLSAEAWIDSMAELQAGDVDDDRRHGPTVWDDQSTWEPPPPAHGPGPIEFRGVVEDGDPGAPSLSISKRTAFVISLSPKRFFTRQAPKTPEEGEPEPIDCQCGAALIDPSV